MCRCGKRFHSDHSRATTGSITTRRRSREACSPSPAHDRRTIDAVFTPVSGTHGVGNNPLVPDGYCHVWRRTFYPHNSGSDRNLRKDQWTGRTRFWPGRGQRTYRFVFANRFPAWNLDGSPVRPYPNASRWFCRDGYRHADVTGRRWPNELGLAHSTGVRGVHSVQPADERRSKLDYLYARPNTVSYAIARDGRWIRRCRCETWRDIGRFPAANL